MCKKRYESTQISGEFETRRRDGWGLALTGGKQGSTATAEQQEVTQQQQQQLLPWVTGQNSPLRFLTWLRADTSESPSPSPDPVDADSPTPTPPPPPPLPLPSPHQLLHLKSSITFSRGGWGVKLHGMLGEGGREPLIPPI